MVRRSPCSLDDEALHQRLRAWESLRAAWVGGEATPTGAVAVYRLDLAAAATLLELIEAERRCCPTLSLEPLVTVRVEAPDALRAWVTSTFVSGPGNAMPGRDDDVGVDQEAVQKAVRAHYADAARRAGRDDDTAECCGAGEPDGIGATVYQPESVAALPQRAVRSSIGCADPVAVADLAPGDVVLDLGSGGGLDVLLSARRVAPTGKAYGLDMTEEMLELARRNQAEAGVENAEFLRGRIEDVPLPDDSVDVVLSNCVVGLSPDKEAAFAEAYRVLRPGGRLAIADVVAEAEPSPEQRAVIGDWVSCLAGCLTRSQYRAALQSAGFVGVSIGERHRVADGFDSVIVRATKP